MAITLPTKPIPAESQDPKRLILFSKAKAGKSTSLAQLPGCLCIDLEGSGYDYIDAMKVKINTVAELKELCQEIIKAGKPYKFIALDTVSRLEDMAKPLALKLFQETPAGANFTGDDVLDAAHGAGYGALRKAVEMCIDMVAKCAPNIILVCHTKDSYVGSGETTIKTISLTGKLGAILASKSDAIAWLHRDEDSNTLLSFNTNDESVEVGARPAHLRNKDIIVGKMQEDGTLLFDWSVIYPSLAE